MTSPVPGVYVASASVSFVPESEVSSGQHEGQLSGVYAASFENDAPVLTLTDALQASSPEFSAPSCALSKYTWNAADVHGAASIRRNAK